MFIVAWLVLGYNTIQGIACLLDSSLHVSYNKKYVQDTKRNFSHFLIPSQYFLNSTSHSAQLPAPVRSPSAIDLTTIAISSDVSVDPNAFNHPISTLLSRSTSNSGWILQRGHRNLENIRFWSHFFRTAELFSWCIRCDKFRRCLCDDELMNCGYLLGNSRPTKICIGFSVGFHLSLRYSHFL